jgi:alanyl-tRNA synthetase
MSKVRANQIRRQFIDFFTARGHTFVPSSPVVPADDPTLLFTNAGMNQFKSIFLGENPRGLKRAANSQKCMRVSGKHNDLEEVGRDHHHHTFFEMLGNWSFGDYYKKEAIAWAWELLTEVWGFSKERLFVTIHHSDGEAGELWKSITDIEPHRIMTFGDKDNFWEMGDTGPCGPCSEIHYDTAADLSDQREVFADPVKGVNGENDRFREIWNLVFIQYDRAADGTLTDLPNTHVDTGMGFERLVSVIQGTTSNYDTDLFRPIITELEKLSGRTYTPDAAGTPFRVIADHIRALTFAITDGAFPSNEGRGYVLRRILRRAYRFGRELGFGEPFLHRLVSVVVDMMGEAFPEARERGEYVAEIIRGEEERFAQTLEQGILRFGEMVAATRAKGSTRLEGGDVFMLYDTFGFPMDLTRLMAGEEGLTIDEEGFSSLMEEQRERARSARKGGGDGLSAEGWVELAPTEGTAFVGYDHDEAEAAVCRYKVIEGDEESGSCTKCLVVLDRTPLYAESGGQVGDTGTLTTAHGRVLAVEDTLKWNEMTVHRVASVDPFPPGELRSPLRASVRPDTRGRTRRNHSATHLLQAALRKVLGDHVTQSGSRVGPEGLRFDFTHFKALSPDELCRIERTVNEWVLEDLPATTEVMGIEEAKAAGAVALFGEKYGETVRVVTMGPVSKELCGGTHVHATGQIGLFHIVSESSIAAGIRRIEAITGLGSLEYLRHKERVVSEASSALKVGEGALVRRLGELSARVKELEAETAQLARARAGGEVEKLFEAARLSPGPFAWVVRNLGVMDKKQFANVSDSVSDAIREQRLDSMVVVLVAEVNGKLLFSASAGKKAATVHGVHCGELVKAGAGKAGGSGGGSPTRAQAGGKEVGKVDEALSAVAGMLEHKAAQG